MSTPAQVFFFEHNIFTLNEFVSAIGNSSAVCQVMLNQHLKRGNIVRIKRGLYASIPRGADAAKYPIDPYAIIAAAASDAVIAYHSALQFHGLAHSIQFQHVFLTAKKMREFQFHDESFRVTQVPKGLPKEKRFIFVDENDHHGVTVRVTQIERTIVDCLDRINLSGGLEEVWRSLNTIEKADVEQILEYVLLLANATTVAKVGFFLKQRQQQWQIGNHIFTQLKSHLPQTVHYLDRNKRIDGKHIKEWKLIVPNELLGEHWEETVNGEDV